MCTVTYIPLDQDSFILTSNRDEKVKRMTFPPEYYEISGKKVLFPKDALAGGTWIAASEKGIIACLLNGGIEKHIPEPSYKKSRGMVLLDLLTFDHIEEFERKYKLCGIEPFTIIWINQDSIYEFRWTSKYKSLTPLKKNKPYIWSSVTLYSREIIRKRQSWFHEWLCREKTQNTDSVRHFHLFAGDGDIENDLQMKREGLQTVSITSLLRTGPNFEMIYDDILNDRIYKSNFNINNNSFITIQ